MSDHIIPSELFMDILSRVPAERLLRLRCVCKSWRRMIDDRYFIKTHLDRQILKVHSGVGGHLFTLNRDKKFCSLSLEDHLLNSDVNNNNNNNNNNNKEFEIAHDMNLNPLWEPPMHIASCNGLMLLCNHRAGSLWSIWNPLTREVHNLPIDDYEEEKVQICSPRSSATTPIMLGGFAYDCVADDYKVLKLARAYYPVGRTHESYTSLYSLKSNSWKRIKDFPSLIFRIISGVFSNGALHYIGLRLDTKDHDHDDDIYSLVAFNLVTEDYRTYKLPFLEFLLGELGGCLSLSRCKHGDCFEVWLMNDYGVENSWTLLFSIAQIEELGCWTLKALSYSKSKRLVLLEKNKSEFFWFDLENKTTKNIKISGSLDVSHSLVSMTSLVRINEGNRKRKVSG